MDAAHNCDPSQAPSRVVELVLSDFLLSFRNTPTTTAFVSPNQMFLSYQPRTELSLPNPKTPLPAPVKENRCGGALGCNNLK